MSLVFPSSCSVRSFLINAVWTTPDWAVPQTEVSCPSLLLSKLKVSAHFTSLLVIIVGLLCRLFFPHRHYFSFAFLLLSHSVSEIWILSICSAQLRDNNFLFLTSMLLRKEEICNSCAALLCPLVIANTARKMFSWMFQKIVAHGQRNKRDQSWDLQLDLESQLILSLASCNNPTCTYLHMALFGHRPGALSLGDFADKFRLQDLLKFLASRRATFLNSLPNWKVGARSLGSL